MLNPSRFLTISGSYGHLYDSLFERRVRYSSDYRNSHIPGDQYLKNIAQGAFQRMQEGEAWRPSDCPDLSRSKLRPKVM